MNFNYNIRKKTKCNRYAGTLLFIEFLWFVIFVILVVEFRSNKIEEKIGLSRQKFKKSVLYCLVTKFSASAGECVETVKRTRNEHQEFLWGHCLRDANSHFKGILFGVADLAIKDVSERASICVTCNCNSPIGLSIEIFDVSGKVTPSQSTFFGLDLQSRPLIKTC